MVQRFSDIVVEVAKLRDYCLSDTHPRGRHKARVIRSCLGLTSGNAEWLRGMLLRVARERQEDLRPTDADAYGARYVLDFAMRAAAGTAVVRSTWIVLTGQDVLRLVSFYVL